MTTNPYEPPQVVDAIGPGSDLKSYAKERLKRPATALLIMSSIHSVFPAIALVSFCFEWFGGNLPTRNPGLPQYLISQSFQLIWLIVISVGAAKMAHFESLRMAYVAAWLSCIPVISPFFVLGIPFGIWAIVRLREPDVLAAFD